MSYEIVKHALDANAFKTGTASAGFINPEEWNKMLIARADSQLVVSKMGMIYTDLLNQPGDTLNITVKAAAVEASDLTETDAVAIDALTYSQVVFSPTERGAAYQLTDKEARRSFFNVMSDMINELGYRLALKKENLVISTLTSGAGNAVVANGVVATDLAATDTIDEADILSARKAIKVDHYTPTDLIVGVEQEADLLALSVFNDASKYGSRDAILGGFIAEAFGVSIHWSDLINPTANRSKALMLGVNGAGQKSFGICLKSLPSIATERFERGRYTDVVAVEDYDVKVLQANAICTIETYAA